MTKNRHEPKRDDERFDSAASQPRVEEIAARAYELYQQRGAEHGRDWDDWFTAERELRDPERTQS